MRSKYPSPRHEDRSRHGAVWDLRNRLRSYLGGEGKDMSTLLEQAFREAQKLPDDLQDELAQQLLNDIESELKWQAALADTDVDMGGFEAMARAALAEDEAGETEGKGFGEA
jgi:phage shock protein A